MAALREVQAQADDALRKLAGGGAVTGTSALTKIKHRASDALRHAGHEARA